MSNWFITGASRGIGHEVAVAALDAGKRVTATGRDVDALRDALRSGEDRVTCLSLDVRDPAQISAATKQATKSMGSIDVLVNNAGYSQMGVFEEVSPEAFEDQYATNVFGAANVLRAVLPVMRRAGGGRVINVASLNGLVARPGSSVYSSSKFALVGISQALAPEVEPFGIKVTAVCPGAIRTDFLDDNSMQWVDESIDAYADFAQSIRDRYNDMNHNQPGDPVKVAHAILELSRREEPPVHVLLGSDAWEGATEAYESRLADFRGQEATARAADLESGGSTG